MSLSTAPSTVSTSVRLEKAVADNRRAVEAADRSGETERLRFAYQALGLHCVAMGAWEEGRALRARGLALDPQEDSRASPDAPCSRGWKGTTRMLSRTFEHSGPTGASDATCRQWRTDLLCSPIARSNSVDRPRPKLRPARQPK